MPWRSHPLPVLALFGPTVPGQGCPFTGVDRMERANGQSDAIDPKWTSGGGRYMTSARGFGTIFPVLPCGSRLGTFGALAGGISDEMDTLYLLCGNVLAHACEIC